MRAPAVNKAEINNYIVAAVQPYCDRRELIHCDKDAPYRTPDGTCNNLHDILQGAAATPQSRFLEPTYGDGRNFYYNKCWNFLNADS